MIDKVLYPEEQDQLSTLGVKRKCMNLKQQKFNFSGTCTGCSSATPKVSKFDRNCSISYGFRDICDFCTKSKLKVILFFKNDPTKVFSHPKSLGPIKREK